LLYLGYLVARLVAAVVPLGMACWIAERVGDLWYASSPRLRGDLDHNLALLRSTGSNRSARRRLARRIVRNFAKVVAEFLYLPRVSSRNLGRLVDPGSLAAAVGLVGSKPALLVTAHLGNWELGAAAMAMTGADLQVVVYDHPDRRIAAMFRRRREAKGLKVMSVKSAARNLSSALETSSVGIAGDRDFTGQGTPATFFGIRTRVPGAYAGLAATKGVPVIPGFCVRQPDGRYRYVVEEPIVAGGDGAADAPAIVARCLALFEKYIEKYPEQWYLFEKIGA
jgi:KDO2-lipid IV(A) lauroyltransferase